MEPDNGCDSAVVSYRTVSQTDRLLSALPPLHTSFPMLALSLTALTLTVLPLLQQLHCLALAAHVACSWKLGPGSPEHYGYELFCQAKLGDSVEMGVTAEYRCGWGYFGAKGTKVASFGGKIGQILDMSWYRRLHLVAHRVHCSPLATISSSSGRSLS